MTESGAAVCIRLGHPEGCACWLQVQADVDWMLRIMADEDLRARKMAAEWEAFAVEMVARVLQAKLTSNP